MISYVNLFSGAGGWEVGARGLGLFGVGIEQWSPAVRTATAAGFATWQGDARLINPADDARLSHVPGLIASPPCQDYSLTGRRAGHSFIDQMSERIRAGQTYAGDTLPNGAGLSLLPLAWVQQRIWIGKPFEWVAMEQVPPVLPLWEAYADVLKHYGYQVWVGTLNAWHYDVPQERHRAVLLARRDRTPMAPPQGGPGCGFAGALGLVGDWSLTSNNNTGGLETRGVRHSPAPSFTLTTRCTRMKLVEGHIPAPTSTAGLGRNITTAQAGILQSFPADYPWQGTADEKATQIGNAIPPALAGAILSEVSK